MTWNPCPSSGGLLGMFVGWKNGWKVQTEGICWKVAIHLNCRITPIHLQRTISGFSAVGAQLANWKKSHGANMARQPCTGLWEKHTIEYGFRLNSRMHMEHWFQIKQRTIWRNAKKQTSSPCGFAWNMFRMLPLGEDWEHTASCASSWSVKRLI